MPRVVGSVAYRSPVALGHGIAVVGAPGADGAVAVFRAPVE